MSAPLSSLFRPGRGVWLFATATCWLTFLMAVLFWAIGKRNISKGLIGENDLLAIDPEALKEAQALEAGTVVVEPVPEEA